MTEQVTWSKPEAGPWSRSVSDPQGRAVVSETYANGDVNALRSRTRRAYEAGSGRLIATRVDEADGAGGVTGQYVETGYAYDDAGRRYRVDRPGGGFTKTLYDWFGRAAAELTGSSPGSPEGHEVADPANDGESRVTHRARWYDHAHRPTHVVEYGAEGGTSGNPGTP